MSDVVLPARVRMESPEALFAPDHQVETPVPAPLYLLSCLRLPLVTSYPMGPQGTVIEPQHHFQRQEIVYPDGSRFVAEIASSPSVGLPTIYDLDYLLGVLRLADELGQEPDGSLPGVTYAQVIRATRSDASIAPSKVAGTKRAFARWGNSSLRTTIEMSFAEAAKSVAEGKGRAVVPTGSPTRRERDVTHWILTYDWETEQYATRSRDTIRTLKLNPVWREQTDLGLAAWMDVDAHNALSSPIAKGIHLNLILAAAQGKLPPVHVVPLEWWAERLGVQSKEDGNKIAARFAEAIRALVKAEILSAGEVRSPKRGQYEVAIEMGRLPREASLARGIGSLDPVRTRTLLWHLGQLGMATGEARGLLAAHGMDVERVLRRVHYERTVKGGVDAQGRAIAHWGLWVTKALKKEWRFEEPEYQAWCGRLLGRFAQGPSRPSLLSASPAKGRADEARAEEEREAASTPLLLPADEVWGAAVTSLAEEIGEVQLRTWFQSTWLREAGESVVRVGTDNAFAVEWIQSRWGDRLSTVLSRQLGREVRLILALEHEGAPLP